MRAIDVMHRVSKEHKLNWNDEDMLCILCSFVEHLINGVFISPKQFQAYLERTAAEDKAALLQPDMTH